MAFIDAMRAEGRAVESTCRVLREQGCQVAARTYRDWRRAGPAARTVTDAQLIDAIKELCWSRDHEGVLRLTPEGLYGRRKLTAALRRQGLTVAECTVARAMRTLQHQGIVRSKGVRTTIPAKDGRRAGDLLDRDFTAPAPNRKWVTDFTYVRTWAGFVYVAFVVDVYAQRIVAWHAATSKAVELVMTPLRMALWQRDRDGHIPTPGELIFHSDAGSQQYTSRDFAALCNDLGVSRSMGNVGTSADNALAESFNATLKRETLQSAARWTTADDARHAVFKWVTRYNTRRGHSHCAQTSPGAYENAHYAAACRVTHQSRVHFWGRRPPDRVAAIRAGRRDQQ